MFGAISKMVGFFLKEGEESEVGEKTAELPTESGDNRLNGIQESVSLTETHSKEDTKAPRCEEHELLDRSYTGKITFLANGRGFIDKNIYFTLNSFVARKKQNLTIGDLVTFDIVKSGNFSVAENLKVIQSCSSAVREESRTPDTAISNDSPASDTDIKIPGDTRADDCDYQNQAVSADNVADTNKCFTGKITSLFNGRGLIEDHVYFTLNVVIGGELVHVGDDVHVEASRTHSEGGWIANKIQLLSDWTTTANENKRNIETMVKIVKYFSTTTQTGKLDNEIEFSRSVCQYLYTPYQGDFVKTDLERSGEDQVNVVSVCPVRQKKITGTVTDFSGKFGFIDNDLYFQIFVCIRGYTPRKGDKVTAVAIESKSFKGGWRAMSVAPEFDTYQPR